MTANASHPGRVCIPGTSIGVAGTLVAEPQTENMLLTLDDRLVLGPVKVDVDPNGNLYAPGLVVPIVSGVLWLLRFEPHRHDVPPFSLGVFNLNTSGVDLKDLIATSPIAIDPTVQSQIAAAVALGATNDTATASFVTNPASATRTAGDAVYGLKPTNGARAVGKGELMLNAKDYGATGNGTTDDSAAIQAALNAGSNVYLPPGTYLCGTRLTLSANGCLTGAGRSTSVIKAPTGMTDYQVELGTFGSRVSNLQIDGSDTACQGVLINDAQEQSGLEHVLISGQRGRCLHVTTGGSIAAQNYFVKDVELYRSATADANPTFHIGAGTGAAARTIRDVTINVVGLGTPPAGTVGFRCEVGNQSVDFMHIEHHPIAVDLPTSTGFQGRSISMSQGCTRGIVMAAASNSVVLQGISNTSAGHTSTIEDNGGGSLVTYNADIYGFALFSGGGAAARNVMVAESGSAGAKYTLTNVATIGTFNMPITLLANKPAAVAAQRGKIFTLDSGAGVADLVQICVKDAAGAYSWKTVTLT